MVYSYMFTVTHPAIGVAHCKYIFIAIAQLTVTFMGCQARDSNPGLPYSSPAEKPLRHAPP
jgi:hypothetical protein